MNDELDHDILQLLGERKRTMAEFHTDYRPLNMYVICRADLEMTPWKISSSMRPCLRERLRGGRAEERPVITSKYKGTGEGTKIVMYAKSLETLVRAYRDIQKTGLPHHLVIDRGHKLRRISPETPSVRLLALDRYTGTKWSRL